MKWQIELVPGPLRPLARTLFFSARTARATVLARVPVRPAHRVIKPIFIIGCGRSGTTLLGNLFGAHPGVRYLNERYDFWAAVEPRTDFLQLYSRGEHSCLLGASAASPTAKRRFERLMSPPRGLTLVEKSPINTLRIGYLEALAPDARYVHIVRDGIDVVHSVSKLAAATSTLAFRPPLNDWWGVGDVKWAAMERDGRAAGYYPGEAGLLTTDSQRGAYEWLLSLHEVQAWRERLGTRLVEFRYEDLAGDPRGTLKAAAGALDLPCPEVWLEEATGRVEPGRRTPGAPLALPARMCTDFNMFQEKFGFAGRAERLPDATA